MNTLSLRDGMVLGLAIGGSLCLVGYQHIGWYHSMIDWELSHWWLFLPLTIAGYVVGRATD